MPGAGKKQSTDMAKSDFTAKDIPAKVSLRGCHYQSTIVKAIQSGFAHGCDYTTALALFGVGLRTGVIEQDPKDPDYYRILEPKSQQENE